ncbi:sn-glycerol 3-phosphate transport system substrate-binding protein [Paenibacillus cellulosilyticus]|uniref:sn-glycerol 3-phosphate transport system substrate-binding protein n=1 Tax=Paenibacillus cellulosilyticus TaxID=375489 RepID=A0A2V2YR89_9BACL|nr:ABC transporter substrate-binding protein [Paenibacillus cellulosilyticus]PWV97408.1 sn-glycerol 3-phosphate transport system substrate-binding protein [Paenibacillus cellulosilyticus]QKS48551.1 ABC transporter substrate-binding protein [Paenibacillus cellulosilyticus]
MKKLRSKEMLAASSIAFLLVATACGSTNDSNTDKSSEQTPATASTSNESTQPSSADSTSTAAPVKITWWHSMSGTNEEAIKKIVSDFNASQSNIQVEAVFQGTYDESLSKLKASMGSKDGPDIVQVYEIGSRFMVDSGYITPIQQFIDADKFDLTQLEPHITNYYSMDGKLNGMPFNTSNPILYYNKDAFKKAGLDPESPPKTYEEFEADAKALTKSGITGGSIAIYGWFMEQFFANQNAEYLNNGNGRTTAASESLVNTDAGVKTLTWWKSMLDEKSISNLGRKTADTSAAFTAGQIAMTLDSTASLRNIVNGVAGKFEVGTGFLPRPSDAKEGGVVIGGASNYILNNKSEAEQKAAWDFIKYLATPEVQAFWNVSTGYFPITKAAYDQQVLKDNMAKFPQFQTAVDQLHASIDSSATNGAMMGVFPEARQIVEGAIEATLNGQQDPKAALDEAAKQINDKLATYNSSAKK